MTAFEATTSAYADTSFGTQNFQGSLFEDPTAGIVQEQFQTARLESGDRIADAGDLTDNQLLEQLHEGFEKKLDIKLAQSESYFQNGSTTDELRRQERQIDQENWRLYHQYLAPATTRATRAFDLIGTGADNSIKEGERLLIEAVLLRPELQFKKSFQQDIIRAYERMAANRDGQTPFEGTIDMPSMEGNSDPLLKQRLEQFKNRLSLDRSIALARAGGKDTRDLMLMRNQVTDAEWQTYQEHLRGANQLAESAFQKIATGDSQQEQAGREQLLRALRQNPELDFTQSFYDSINMAYDSYRLNKRLSNRRQAADLETADLNHSNATPEPWNSKFPPSAFAPPPLPDAYKIKPAARSPQRSIPAEVPQPGNDRGNPGTERESTPPGQQEQGDGRDTARRTGNEAPERNEPAHEVDLPPRAERERFQPPSLEDVTGEEIAAVERILEKNDPTVIEQMKDNPMFLVIAGVLGYQIIKRGGKYIAQKIRDRNGNSTTESETERRPESERGEGERETERRPESERGEGERETERRPESERGEGERETERRPESERGEGERETERRPESERGEGERETERRPESERGEGERETERRPESERGEGERETERRPESERGEGERETERRPESERGEGERETERRPESERGEGERETERRPESERGEGERETERRPESERGEGESERRTVPESERGEGESERRTVPESERGEGESERRTVPESERGEGESERRTVPESERGEGESERRTVPESERGEGNPDVERRDAVPETRTEKPLSERVAEAPAEIRSGLSRLMQLANENPAKAESYRTLISNIFKLHSDGRLPEEVKPYMTQEWANLIDTDTADLIRDQVEKLVEKEAPARGNNTRTPLTRTQIREAINEAFDHSGEEIRLYEQESRVPQVKRFAETILARYLPGVEPTHVRAGNEAISVFLNDGTVLKFRADLDWDSSWGTREKDAPLKTIDGKVARPMLIGERGERMIVFRQDTLEPPSASEIRSFQEWYRSRFGSTGDFGSAVDAAGRQLGRYTNPQTGQVEVRVFDYAAMEIDMAGEHDFAQDDVIKEDRSERRAGESERASEETTRRAETPTETESRDNQPRQRRPRLREGGPVEVERRVEATGNGDGTYDRRVAVEGDVGSGRATERLATSEVDILRAEAERLKSSENEAERRRARDIERVVRIVEGEHSPKLQDAAHRWLRKQIDAETGRRGGVSRPRVGHAVMAGIVVSAALSFYASSVHGKEEERFFEDRATVSDK